MSTKCAFFDRFCGGNCTAWCTDSYPTHRIRLDVEYNNSERERLDLTGETLTLDYGPTLGLAIYKNSGRLAPSIDYFIEGVTITLMKAKIAGDVFIADGIIEVL